MAGFSALPEVGSVRAKDVNKLTQSGKVSLVEPCTRSSKKVPAKFADTCYVRADRLCIGCLGQWAERGRKFKHAGIVPHDPIHRFLLSVYMQIASIALLPKGIGESSFSNFLSV